MFPLTLTHFSKIMSFLPYPIKTQRMFWSSDVYMEYRNPTLSQGWLNSKLLIIVVQVVLILSENGAFYIILLIFSFKVVHFQNWKFNGCNILSQELLICLLLNFQVLLGVGKCIHKMNPPICVFLIGCDSNCKNTILFVYDNRHSRWRILCSFTQNHTFQPSSSWKRRFILNPVYDYEPGTRTMVSAEGKNFGF